MKRQIEQYNLFPYPAGSLNKRISRVSLCHLNYETMCAFAFGYIPNLTIKAGQPFKRPVIHIALLGCGTNEPYLFALAHPHDEIHAIDFSENSLQQAKQRCKQANLSNIHFHCMDVLKIGDLHLEFDYINMYGVLHHLEHPAQALQVIAEVLKPQGLLRLMLYPKYSRRYITQLHSLIKLLNIEFDHPSVESLLKELISELPSDHPSKAQLTLYQDKSTTEMIDALFHVHQVPQDIEYWFEILSNNQLSILCDLQAFSSSTNYLKQLYENDKEIIQHLSEEDKLKLMYHSGEMQTNLHLLVTKQSDENNPQIQPLNDIKNRTIKSYQTQIPSFVVTNPILKDLLPAQWWHQIHLPYIGEPFYSPLIEDTIQLKYPIQTLLIRCLEPQLLFDILKDFSDYSTELEQLKQSGFIYLLTSNKDLLENPITKTPPISHVLDCKISSPLLKKFADINFTIQADKQTFPLYLCTAQFFDEFHHFQQSLQLIFGQTQLSNIPSDAIIREMQRFTNLSLTPSWLSVCKQKGIDIIEDRPALMTTWDRFNFLKEYLVKLTNQSAEWTSSFILNNFVRQPFKSYSPLLVIETINQLKIRHSTLHLSPDVWNLKKFIIEVDSEHIEHSSELEWLTHQTLVFGHREPFVIINKCD